MTVHLNGETVDAREARTVEELVLRFDLPPSAIFIEHNGVALHRREWPERQVRNGDRIEFIRVVAGG